MPSRIQLQLYYDCLSPFSYLAHSTLRRYARGPWAERVDLVLRPVLLGGIMAATGNTPPGARPWAAAQAKHGAQDMVRNRSFFNVPHMKGVPSNFFGPGGPSDPAGLARNFSYQRMLTAVRARHPACLAEATRLTFDLIWSDERGASDEVVITPAVLTALLERAGLPAADAAELVGTRLNSPANKAALKEACAEAVARGAFGAPTMCVGDKIWFGSDRLEQVTHATSAARRIRRVRRASSGCLSISAPWQMAFDLQLPWLGPDPARPTAGPEAKL